MRTAQIKRKTAETDITLTLNLDGSGKSAVATGCGFLNHMLTLFAKHGRFDLTVYCKGDVEVDYHHTVEDVGICLGEAMKEALGNKAGINRYGSTILPMDEALVLSAVDLSGRTFLAFDALTPTEKVGDFDCELVEEFFTALVRSAAMTLHVRELAGANSHHILEAVFKSCARSLRTAVAIDPTLGGDIPSSKGALG